MSSVHNPRGYRFQWPQSSPDGPEEDSGRPSGSKSLPAPTAMSDSFPPRSTSKDSPTQASPYTVVLGTKEIYLPYKDKGQGIEDKDRR